MPSDTSQCPFILFPRVFNLKTAQSVLNLAFEIHNMDHNMEIKLPPGMLLQVLPWQWISTSLQRQRKKKWSWVNKNFHCLPVLRCRIHATETTRTAEQLCFVPLQSTAFEQYSHTGHCTVLIKALQGHAKDSSCRNLGLTASQALRSSLPLNSHFEIRYSLSFKPHPHQYASWSHWSKWETLEVSDCAALMQTGNTQSWSHWWESAIS